MIEVTLYKVLVRSNGVYRTHPTVVQNQEEADALFAGSEVDFIQLVDPMTVEVPDLPAP